MKNLENNGGQDTTARGGPRTAEGKNASRCNALKHGLSANTLLPESFKRDFSEECFQRLREEWQPMTPTQEFLVRELARHQVALDRIEQIENAVLRRGATGALVFFEEGTDETAADVALAGAGTSDAVHRIVRYRRSHERAYARSMQALREMGAESHPQPLPRTANVQQFNTAAECQSHLVARFKRGELPCPHCQTVQGSLVASRQVWQCRGCRRQRSLRAGTVMERSRIGLVAWFRAIAALLIRPQVSTVDLAEITGIHRKATLGRMARRIREATKSDDSTNRLAGLNTVFLDGGGDD